MVHRLSKASEISERLNDLPPQGSASGDCPIDASHKHGARLPFLAMGARSSQEQNVTCSV